MPTFYVLQGPDKGRTFQTPDEPAVIGRSSERIQLSDTSASRRHAEIRPKNGTWVLVDLNSANGTFLNGRRIGAPTPLRYGDQIKVGSTLLVFGGREHAERFFGEQMIQDLVDLEVRENGPGASILSAVDASHDSLILQPPETADAVVAWNVVFRVAEAIGSIESIDMFLERVSDILFEHVIFDRLVLLMVDPETQKLTPRLVRCQGGEREQRPKIVTSQSIINHVLKTRDGVLCANALTETHLGANANQDSIHSLGLRSIICVPMVTREQVHGLFHLDCSMARHTYTHEQLRLAVAIGRLAGMALENARLLETKMRTARLAAVGETVAFLSHYIRNILQGMQGGAEVVELGFRKHNLESAESGWSLVRRNLDRTLQLAMNMLTFSKERQPRIEPTELNRIVDDAISLVQNRANEKGVVVSFVPEDLPDALLDPDGIHQVTHNILINAIDAVSSQTGRVEVRTHHDQQCDELVLTITDNGVGLSPSDCSRIFDVFHSSKGQGGTGLGLAAAQKIVTELFGRIDVESTVGVGSAFRVRLPVRHRNLLDLDRTDTPE